MILLTPYFFFIILPHFFPYTLISISRPILALSLCDPHDIFHEITHVARLFSRREREILRLS